jgi:oxalate decarboxylase/phosphoglucose isomerase-like protein (cupin superfamily)
VIGQAELLLADVGTGERRTIRVVAADPVTIYVPPGVAHAFRNTSSDEEMLLIAFSDRSYDPADTLAYALGEGTAR